MPVIALTGRDGGDLAPGSPMSPSVCRRTWCSRVQELHLPVYHAFALALEQTFFGQGASDGTADGAPCPPVADA